MRIDIRDAGPDGVFPVLYVVTFLLAGETARALADRLGVTIPAAAGAPQYPSSFPLALSNPVLAEIPSDMTVTSTRLRGSVADYGPTAGDTFALVYEFTSSTTDPNRDFNDAPGGPITLTWPVTGAGTDCEGNALADTLVITHLPSNPR